MKARISTFVVVAAIALTVAAPTAFGEGRLAGSIDSDGVAYFRANELATAASSSQSDAVMTYRDAGERAVPPTSDPITTSPTQSGKTDASVDWPSIGIGIGLGMLALGLGILLTMRFRPNRQLAH